MRLFAFCLCALMLLASFLPITTYAMAGMHVYSNTGGFAPAIAIIYGLCLVFSAMGCGFIFGRWVSEE